MRRKRFTELDLLSFTENTDGTMSPPKNKREARKNAPRAKPTKKEERIQKQVCAYIREKYPDIIFTSDFSSGLHLPIWLAKVAKSMKSSKSLPDIYILEPRKGYGGLMLEMKRDGETIFLKDGSVCADPHVKAQAEILARLNKKGYYASFAIGLKKAMEIIDWYFSDVNTAV